MKFRIVLFLVLAWALVQPVSAQQSAPEWTVPVLRLVSATHVEPTTGLVISTDGQVLVPAGFADENDEIIVLDGGTDIIRNGRPARIESLLPGTSLKILRVDGLRRQPVTFSLGGASDGDAVWLAAFPPAEQIAEGALPIWQESRLALGPGSQYPAFAADALLPNVTGALVDRCGYLLGASIHAEVQSMEVSADTQYRWADSIVSILQSNGYNVAAANCETAPPQEDEPQPEPEPVQPENSEPEPVPEPDVQPPEEAEPEPEPEIPEPALPDPLDDIDVLPPHEVDSGSDWLWLVLAALLIGTGLAVHYWRRRSRSVTPASEEPEASSTSHDSTAGLPVETESAVEDSTPALNHRLILIGSHESGQSFEVSCAVSDKAINCVAGRGEVDLKIESQAVSRSHARLFGTADRLLISDLDSSNGTFVNGVPCLNGETLYVEPGNLVQLGNVRFSVNVVANEDI